MKKYSILIYLMVLVFTACSQQTPKHKVVLCIPVYGQSLAFGEQAEIITNFDSLANYAGGRIVTEYLDHQFGYFDTNEMKLFIKKIIKDSRSWNEASIYIMAQRLADQIGEDTLICTFIGGQGETVLNELKKGSISYQEFMKDIADAAKRAKERDWDFYVPAICWMQGESDIENYPGTDYQILLAQICNDINHDIRRITQQRDSIRLICYQTNTLTRGKRFHAENYNCIETSVPQSYVNLLRDNNGFWASGPTYPYTFVGEHIHIDADGQQHIGTLAAQSALGILRGIERNKGLIPISLSADNQDVIIHFNVPNPPLVIDTTQVRKADNYGFSVITKDNRNIATAATLEGDSIRVTCSENPQNCKVRYAVNGDYMKSGNLHGPRGNLRDAAGNWCYQFDEPLQ